MEFTRTDLGFAAFRVDSKEGRGNLVFGDD